MKESSSSGTIKYIVVTPTDEPQNLLLPQQKKNTREEILVSPSPAPTLIPPEPIQYNFFNIRVIGVLIGIVFLWIYIRNLHKKRN